MEDLVSERVDPGGARPLAGVDSLVEVGDDVALCVNRTRWAELSFARTLPRSPESGGSTEIACAAKSIALSISASTRVWPKRVSYNVASALSE